MQVRVLKLNPLESSCNVQEGEGRWRCRGLALEVSRPGIVGVMTATARAAKEERARAGVTLEGGLELQGGGGVVKVAKLGAKGMAARAGRGGKAAEMGSNAITHLGRQGGQGRRQHPAHHDGTYQRFHACSFSCLLLSCKLLLSQDNQQDWNRRVARVSPSPVFIQYQNPTIKHDTWQCYAGD